MRLDRRLRLSHILRHSLRSRSFAFVQDERTRLRPHHRCIITVVMPPTNGVWI